MQYNKQYITFLMLYLKNSKMNNMNNKLTIEKGLKVILRSDAQAYKLRNQEHILKINFDIAFGIL